MDQHLWKGGRKYENSNLKSGTVLGAGHFAFFGPDRMMYGTDYPFGLEAGEDFIRENLACVKAMDIPEAQKKKILGGNAKKLLKIR